MKKFLIMLLVIVSAELSFYNYCYSEGYFDKTEALQHKADLLIKKNKFSEAIVIIDQALATLSSEAEQARLEIDALNKKYDYNSEMVEINRKISRNNKELEILHRQGLYLERSQAYFQWSIYKKNENDIDINLAAKSLASIEEAENYYKDQLFAFEKKSSLTEEEKKQQESYIETIANILIIKVYIETRIEKRNNNQPRNKKFREGKKFAGEKKYAEAVRSFTAAIKIDPDFTDAYKELAMCYIEQEKYSNALNEYDNIIRINSKNNKADPSVYLLRAKVLYKQQMYAKALEDLEKSPSDDGETYYYRGFCYEQLNDIDNAVKNFEIAVSRYPNWNYLAHERLFYYYYNKNDYKNALRICDLRLNTFNNDTDMLIKRGKIYLLMSKDYTKALADFNKAVETYPSEEAYYYRGLTYAYNNEWDLAIRDWNNEKCNYNFTKLFHKKSDINAVDENGANVAMWVVYDQKLELLKLLCKKGADVEQKGIIWINKDEGTYYGGILHLAAGSTAIYGDDKLAIVKFLVENCDIDVNDGELDSTTKKVIPYTPLFFACYSGNYEIFQYLVSKGANINAEYNGMTPMSALISGTINEEIFNYLHKSRAKVNYKDPNLFLRAAHYGDFKVVAVFIENGADINSNQKGLTALHYAAKYGKIEAVEFLIKNHINVNFNENGLTALQYAVAYGHKEIVELLLKNGADYTIPFIKKDNNQKETDRWTPLQLAQKKKFKEIIALLKKYGAKK